MNSNTRNAPASDQPTPTQLDYRQRLLRVLVHIQQHLDESLSLDDLAAIAHFSPFHFHRIFTGMVGETLAQHIRRLRLERAALRLQHTDQPVTGIAFDAGYETHESFTRAFRSAFDQSPSQYRQHSRATHHITAPTHTHFDDDAPHQFTPIPHDETVPMHVHIRAFPAHRVAFMRHTGPYMNVGRTWDALMQWAGSRQLLGPDMTAFGLAWDDPTVTPADKLRYDACLAVGDSIDAEGEVGIQTTRAGAYATTTHQGPYEQLEDIYLRLFGQWMPSSGREPAASPAMEIYLNNPKSTPPDKLLTQICIPLESAD